MRRRPVGRRRGAEGRVFGSAMLACLAVAAALRALPAQTIDTVLVERSDIFPLAAATGWLHRAVNALHPATRAWVVRQEVLLEAGVPWDSALAAETERNLRRRGLFRTVEVDSQTVDGRLAAVVRTVDAWSLLPRLEAQVAADGTLTGAAGGTETNLAGTGQLVRLWYVRDVDRDGAVVAAGLPRIGRSRAGMGGTFQSLSDRRAGSWAGGVSFRSLSDGWSLILDGEAFDGRVLSFRSEDAGAPDTTRWQRRAVVQRASMAHAPRAGPEGYLRIGLSAELRRESFFARRLVEADSARFVPDSVFGLIGAWAEIRRADFLTVRHLNGFTEEDQDLSRVLFFGFKLAPSAWGYRRDGAGLRGRIAAGTRLGDATRRSGSRAFLKLLADGQGRFDGAGLDSGRVVVRGTATLLPAPRHATFLALSGGLQADPPPGREFDLGFRTPPRLWPPHAFTGTRSLAVTFQHRWFAWDGPSEILGLGLTGFLDYGGAWFADQDPRLGGDLGGGLLVGWPLRSAPLLTEIVVGWRFGGGLRTAGGDRLAASLGTGLAF